MIDVDVLCLDCIGEADVSVIIRNNKEECSRFIYFSCQLNFSLPTSVNLPSMATLSPVGRRLV